MSFIWASRQGNPTLLHANNKGADQPAHLLDLISAFVACYQEIIAVKFAPHLILIFYLVSVAEPFTLSHTWSETPKSGFLVPRPTSKIPNKAHTRPLVKSAYQKNNFISQPKHMLWVLKRTVSMRRFF